MKICAKNLVQQNFIKCHITVEYKPKMSSKIRSHSYQFSNVLVYSHYTWYTRIPPGILTFHLVCRRSILEESSGFLPIRRTNR